MLVRPYGVERGLCGHLPHSMRLATVLCWFLFSGKKGKSGGKKGSSKLVLTPETERLLAHICVCLEFLVAGDNADCYTVAAYGCLPALVQLASDSKNTQLRRAAKVSKVRLPGTCMVWFCSSVLPRSCSNVITPSRFRCVCTCSPI